jgi:SNF2 family DNA or RNA helicase
VRYRSTPRLIELMRHQKEAVERARSLKRMALFFEAGTGKTATAVTILREDFNRAKKIARTLILSPLTVCPQWKEEFLRFSKIPGSEILILTQSGLKRTEALKRARGLGHTPVVITNYESVQIKSFYEELLNWSPESVILDECHRIKDSTSKRAKLIYPLIHGAERRLILTGTPILNSLLDIFGQYKALDPLIFGGGFWSFRSKYFYDRNSGKKFSFPDWIPHPHAAEEIGQVLKRTSMRAKRSECLDLPPLSYIAVPCELSAPQKKAYEEMKKDFMTEVGGMVASSEFEMVKTLRMQQILTGFVQLDDTKEPAWFSEQPRIQVLLDLLNSIGKEQVIIWTTFKPSYQKIGEALAKEKYTYAYVTGEQSTKEKNDHIAAFKRGEYQILIANPAAASEGINLQEAKYAIYFARGYNLLHYLQSLARNYRQGSNDLHDKVVHYHIVAKDTLDEVIARALRQKENIGGAVLKWASQNN